MALLFDTNILVAVVRSKNISGIAQYLNPRSELVYISVASEAEIRSLSVKNSWGNNRKSILEEFLADINIIDIGPSYVNTYVEIDTFSQRSNPSFITYDFDTPRNMGKNDLWIASCAALLGLKLITTDADFDHLHNVFFEVKRIKPADFTPFF